MLVKIADPKLSYRKTPAHIKLLIGKIVELLEYEDLAYESSYPTGEEPRQFLIRFQNGEERYIETCFVRKLNGERLTWEHIENLPRNF